MHDEYTLKFAAQAPIETFNPDLVAVVVAHMTAKAAKEASIMTSTAELTALTNETIMPVSESTIVAPEPLPSALEPTLPVPVASTTVAA